MGRAGGTERRKERGRHRGGMPRVRACTYARLTLRQADPATGRRSAGAPLHLPGAAVPCSARAPRNRQSLSPSKEQARVQRAGASAGQRRGVWFCSVCVPHGASPLAPRTSSARRPGRGETWRANRSRRGNPYAACPTRLAELARSQRSARRALAVEYAPQGRTRRRGVLAARYGGALSRRVEDMALL